MYLILPLIVSAIASLYYDGRPESRGSLTIYALIGIWLALFAGLRYHVGVDTFKVELLMSGLPPIYEFDSSTLSSTYFEPGLPILSGVCLLFAPGFLLPQLICNFWINFSIFLFARRYCPQRLFLFVFLYIILQYLNLNFEIMRHSVGIAFLLFSWPYFERKDWLPYVFLNLCGVLFHRGMVVALLLPILAYRPLKELFTGRIRFLILCVCMWAFGLGLYLLREYMAAHPDVSPLLRMPVIAGYGATYPLYMTLNWKGVAQFIALQAIWPLAAMLWSRSRWLPAMLGILMAFMVNRRLLDTFSIFVIVMLANAFGERPKWLNLPMAVASYLLPLALIIWSRLGTVPMPAGGTMPNYRKYYPYYSWINPKIDSLRETYMLSLKDLDYRFKASGDSLIEIPEDSDERPDTTGK